MLLYFILNHLYGCLSYFRGLYQQVQDSTCNLTFETSFIVVFFRIVHNEKIFRWSSVKYQIFLKWSFSFLQLEKTWVICTKIVAYNGKNRKISGPHNFWTPKKSSIPDLDKSTSSQISNCDGVMLDTRRPYLVWKLRWGEGSMVPPGRYSGYAPDSLGSQSICKIWRECIISREN